MHEFEPTLKKKKNLWRGWKSSFGCLKDNFLICFVGGGVNLSPTNRWYSYSGLRLITFLFTLEWKLPNWVYFSGDLNIWRIVQLRVVTGDVYHEGVVNRPQGTQGRNTNRVVLGSQYICEILVSTSNLCFWCAVSLVTVIHMSVQ